MLQPQNPLNDFVPDLVRHRDIVSIFHANAPNGIGYDPARFRRVARQPPIRRQIAHVIHTLPHRHVTYGRHNPPEAAIGDRSLRDELEVELAESSGTIAEPEEIVQPEPELKKEVGQELILEPVDELELINLQKRIRVMLVIIVIQLNNQLVLMEFLLHHLFLQMIFGMD
mgnify:CR=1 FL=1